MFQQDPQQRLWLINQRNAELIHAAQQHRLSTAQPEDTAGHLWSRLLDRPRASLRRAFAYIRRAMSAPEVPCDDSVPTAPLA
jgi:hypothetical protein